MLLILYLTVNPDFSCLLEGECVFPRVCIPALRSVYIFKVEWMDRYAYIHMALYWLHITKFVLKISLECIYHCLKSFY